jgi:hypothetical protein
LPHPELAFPSTSLRSRQKWHQSIPLPLKYVSYYRSMDLYEFVIL